MKSEAETEEGQERLPAFCWASANSYLLQRETSYRGSTDSPETVPYSGLDRLSFATACGRAAFPGGEGFNFTITGKIPAMRTVVLGIWTKEKR